MLLIGFSGGAAFAGGLILDDPSRFAGAAILHGTLPFDAGVPTTPGRLKDKPVLVAQSDGDRVIPAELLARTWDYLTGESEARATTNRSTGGHSIDSSDVKALAAWITDVVGQPAAPEKEV